MEIGGVPGGWTCSVSQYIDIKYLYIAQPKKKCVSEYHFNSETVVLQSCLGLHHILQIKKTSLFGRDTFKNHPITSDFFDDFFFLYLFIYFIFVFKCVCFHFCYTIIGLQLMIT